ncbi:MAG: AI-2E family transporter [Anaerolineaceae bacterium]|nr:AI-2E family transporter [Anaerolineaceae bacterium]
MTKRVLWAGTAVMTTLLALALFWQFRLVVIYVLVSLALASAARPLIKRPAGQSLAVRLALILLYLVLLGSFGLLLVLGSGAAIRGIQELAQQVSVQDAWQQPVWLQGSALQQFLDTRLPPPSDFFAALIGENGQLVLPAILGFTQGIFTILSSGIVVLFLSLYWSMDQIHFERLWLSLLPPVQRTRARDIWQTIESDLGAYIRSEVAQSLLAGVLLGLGYWALGSPYPALLAFAGAAALLIPVAGAALALLPPLLLGLLTGVPLSLMTAFYTLIIIGALKWWIEPHFFARKQKNPMLTLLFLIALADAYGLLGIVVAPPLSTACQILWNRLVSHRAASEASSKVSDLKERQAKLWTMIETLDEAPPLITSSMARLATLIENAEPILQLATEQGDLFPLDELSPSSN